MKIISIHHPLQHVLEKCKLDHKNKKDRKFPERFTVGLTSDATLEGRHLYASGATVKRVCSQRGTLLGMPYPFITREGSSGSSQAAELTKRFSGGRAMLFPGTFLETIVIT